MFGCEQGSAMDELLPSIRKVHESLRPDPQPSAESAKGREFSQYRRNQDYSGGSRYNCATTCNSNT